MRGMTHIPGGYWMKALAISLAMAVGGASAVFAPVFSWHHHHSPATTQTTTTPVLPAVSPGTPATPAGSGYVGMFVDTAPSDPTFKTSLDAVAATGSNIVYSYNGYDGTSSQVNAYLAYANSKGLKVIIGLNDFYDGLHSSASEASLYPQYGSDNQSIALGIVRQFQSNPAVWGFSITDETPEGPSDLAKWQGTLNARFQAIKGLTAKPVMAVLVGWPDDNSSVRTSFFTSSKSFANTLALDYYPVPYEPISRITTIMQNAGPGNWFVEQDFSWASYPDVARGLGDDLSQARLPTQTEMVAMAKGALAGGAQNILFYSYFDIKNNPAQLTAVKQAITAIRQ